jgi:hypothetical protein
MKDISRRDFMKLGGMMAVSSMLSPLTGIGRALAQAPVVGIVRQDSVTDSIWNFSEQSLP